MVCLGFKPSDPRVLGEESFKDGRQEGGRAVGFLHHLSKKECGVLAHETPSALG